MDTSNWKTDKRPPDLRQKIVKKIYETLIKHGRFVGPEKLQDVKNIAMNFEEKIYDIATSQEDYLRKISTKLVNFEQRSLNPRTDSSQSNSTGNPVNPSDQGSQGMQQVNNRGQPTPVPVPVPSNHPQPVKQILLQNNHNIIASSALPPGGSISQSTISNMPGQNSSLQNIKNVPAVQQTSLGNNMEQGMRLPPTNFVSQRPVPGSQPQPQNSQQYRYQQQLHQMAKQSHIQQHKLSQPSHFQTSQQSIMQPTMLQNQQPASHQSFLKPQRPQQPQSRLMGPQNNLASSQHTKLSGIHQQHVGPGPQSSQKQQQMMNNQHSAHMIQSTQGQRPQVDLQQLLMPQLQTHPGQLQNQLDIKPRLNLSQGDVQQRPPTSGALQQQNVTDQQKQLMQTQRVKVEASSTSSESTAQTGSLNCGDWQEEVFQKMKVLKDKYMPELKDLYQKCASELQHFDSLTQQQKPEQFEKLQKFKAILESCIRCLQFPKNKIPPNHNETLIQVEKHIIKLVMTYTRKPGITTQQPITAPHIDSMHQSQQTQVLPHENQMQSINLQHNKVASLQHNNMGPNSNMLFRQQLKQLQNRDMQQQIMHKQQLLNHQQHQFNPQTKQLQQNVNKINNARQMIEIKSESLQQQFKSGPTFSSPQIDQQNVPNSVTKSSTPMQSVNSAFIASSPSTPSTAHMPIESEKVNACVSSLNGHQTTAAMLHSQPLATGNNGNRDNGASVEASGKSSTTEDAIERLLRAVKSASAKSLNSLANDIGSVASTIDSIAGSAPGNGSRAEIGEDLVSATHFRHKRPLNTHNVTTEAREANFFDVVSSASSVNDSVNNIDCLGPTEAESTETSTSKRCRVEKINPLVEEIRKINQGLVDTVVKFSQEDVDEAVSLEVGKGTIVKCTFNPVYLRYASAQMPLIQPLQLLVPSNYPNCSPIILDKIPLELSKEHADLSTKAKLRFSSCLRGLISDPMSLEEMVKSWDVSCREVLLEHAQKSGGGTFTSKYGAWEDCLTAV